MRDAPGIQTLRQRFFDEGVRPLGWLPDWVWQSWQRCQAAGVKPGDQVAFEPVSSGKAGYLAGRDHVLLKAAGPAFDELQAAVAHSGCKVLLTDRHGVILRVTPAARDEGEVLHAACRVGVDLGGATAGASAPALALSLPASAPGPRLLQQGEHFHDALSGMRCAASVIRNRHGSVVAALDLSVEGRGFGFDAAWLVHSYARRIENRLRVAQTRQQLLLRLHSSPLLVHGWSAGLAAVDEAGRISWMDDTAAALLGVSPLAPTPHRAEALLGQDLAGLMRLGLGPRAQPLTLPNGLTVWLQAQYRDLGRGEDDATAQALAIDDGPADGAEGADGWDVSDLAATAVPPNAADSPSSGARLSGSPAAGAHEPQASLLPASPAAQAATLAEINQELITRVLADCGGNIARAARRLGVSRGLLYRRLRATGGTPRN